MGVALPRFVGVSLEPTYPFVSPQLLPMCHLNFLLV